MAVVQRKGAPNTDACLDSPSWTHAGAWSVYAQLANNPISLAHACCYHRLQALAMTRVDLTVGAGGCLPSCSLFCPTDDLAVAVAGPGGAALFRMDAEAHNDSLRCVGSSRAVGPSHAQTEGALLEGWQPAGTSIWRSTACRGSSASGMMELPRHSMLQMRCC